MIGNIVAGTFSVPVAPVTSSYESIATTTLGSNQSSVTFTESGSAWADYKHLQLRISSKTTNGSTEGVFQMTFNGDTGANYSNHNLSGYGTGTEANGWSSQNYMRAGWTSGNNVGDVYGAQIIDILDFKSTSKNKTMRSLTGYDNNGSSQILLVSGAWLSTSAITSFTLTPLSGQFTTYSSFALYGIKD